MLFPLLLAGCFVHAPTEYPSSWGQLSIEKNETSTDLNGKYYDDGYVMSDAHISSNNKFHQLSHILWSMMSCINNDIDINYETIAIESNSVTLQIKGNADIEIIALQDDEPIGQMKFVREKDYVIENGWIKLSCKNFGAGPGVIGYEQTQLHICMNEQEDLIIKRIESGFGTFALLIPAGGSAVYWHRFLKKSSLK